MKILQVALGNQLDIRDALTEMGDVVYWDWSNYGKVFNSAIRKLTDDYKPNLIWLQIQTPGILSVQTAKYLASKAFVVNWTGDVRSPLPKWYIEIGREIGLTLFTNDHDVNEIRRHGVKANYLQIGVPDKIFTPTGKARNEAEIIFMGNNVGGFPLSTMRIDMVQKLTKRYGKRFKAYGLNWQGYTTEFSQPEEAKIYRGAKIGINLSHFNYSRYSSDRIFRMMGAGVMCLSHHYTDIEKEFEIGKHLDVWNNIEDLFAKIDYYLENDEKRIAIAKEGCNHTHANHTWRNRIEDLKKMLPNDI